MENLSLVIFVQKLKMFLYKSYFSVTLSTGLIAYFHDYSYVLAIIPVLQRLNQICTVQGHCGACWRKWQLADTDLCVLAARLRWCPTLSNHVLWQSWMAAYPGCTLRIKTLLPGWSIMGHDMHTRRRRQSDAHTHRVNIKELSFIQFCCCFQYHSETVTPLASPPQYLSAPIAPPFSRTWWSPP